MNKKALIAMSGGVDSSVAAAMTVAAGYECIGAMMRLYDARSCGSEKDREDARRVAEKLGMAFQVLDYRSDFATEVIDRFVQAYERGYTPNPCIACNRHMKFRRLYEQARLCGCDTVVTGHYARVEYDETENRFRLKKARHLSKDQSYVLYFLTQDQLAHLRFPLGEVESKEEARRLAEEYGFSNADKHDSQDICFVENGKYAEFIRQRTGREYPSGHFVDEEGRVLGEHKGIIGYTVGQRKGLGLSLPAPLYVCRKCVEDNTVVLTPEERLYSDRLLAEDFNWISGTPPSDPLSVAARTRYSAKESPATATVLPDGRVEIVFDTPQRAITAGQAVVLYCGDEVIGGGTIC